jgi:hypothetical protein
VQRDACYNCGTTLHHGEALQETQEATEQSPSKKARPKVAVLVAILVVVCLVGAAIGYLAWLWSPSMEARRLAGTYDMVSAHLVPGVGAAPGIAEVMLVPPTISGRMVIAPDGSLSQGVSTSYQYPEAQELQLPNSGTVTGTGTFYPRQGLFRQEPTGQTGTYRRDGDLLTTVVDVGTYRETDVWRRVQ